MVKYYKPDGSSIRWEYKYGMLFDKGSLLVQGLITGVNNYNVLKIEVLSKYFDNNIGLFKKDIIDTINEIPIQIILNPVKLTIYIIYVTMLYSDDQAEYLNYYKIFLDKHKLIDKINVDELLIKDVIGILNSFYF